MDLIRQKADGLGQVANLCARCSDIDFETIFAMRFESGEGSFVATFREGDPPAAPSSCGFCMLIMSKSLWTTDPSEEGLGKRDKHIFECEAIDIQLVFNSPREIPGCRDNVVLLVTEKMGSKMLYCYDFGQKADVICEVVPKVPGDDVPIINGRELKAYSIDYSIMKGWLDHCNRFHGEDCSF